MIYALASRWVTQRDLRSYLNHQMAQLGFTVLLLFSLLGPLLHQILLYCCTQVSHKSSSSTFTFVTTFWCHVCQVWWDLIHILLLLQTTVDFQSVLLITHYRPSCKAEIWASITHHRRLCRSRNMCPPYVSPQIGWFFACTASRCRYHQACHTGSCAVQKCGKQKIVTVTPWCRSDWKSTVYAHFSRSVDYCNCVV